MRDVLHHLVNSVTVITSLFLHFIFFALLIFGWSPGLHITSKPSRALPGLPGGPSAPGNFELICLESFGEHIGSGAGSEHPSLNCHRGLG